MAPTTAPVRFVIPPPPRAERGSIEPLFQSEPFGTVRGTRMARGIALAVGLTTAAAWLGWAEHLAGGWRPVLATAGLWWLAALEATWRVWLPAVVTVVALWLALPPRAPRRRAFREPAAPIPPAASGAADGVAEEADPGGRPGHAPLSLAQLIVLSRVPEGAAALAAQVATAPGGGARSLEPEAAANGAGEIDQVRAPVPEPEDEDTPEPDAREPAHEPTPERPQVVTPASVPTPVRTVWEAFTPLDQEAEDDDAA
jgi:hypothetical protein